MARYKIEIKKSALKEIKQLPLKDLNKILKIIEDLSIDPRPSESKKLSEQERYRLRYRHYRILYEICDDILIVYIVRVAHRRDAYKFRDRYKTI